MHYPLKDACDRAALEDALGALPDLRRTGDNLWNWTAAATPAAGKAPKGAQTFTSIFEDGSVSMGSLELEAKALKLETNSPERAVMGQALLDPVIGRFVGEPVVESQTVAEMKASRSASDGPARSSTLSSAEERAIVHEAIERHYRGLLDQPVPMLGDVTPRNAAKAKKGREKLVDWLKLIENSLAKEPDSLVAGYDVRWMWDELGIADLRR